MDVTYLPLLAIVGVSLCFVPAFGENNSAEENRAEQRARFNVPRTPEAPSLTGTIEEEEWEHALQIRGMAHTKIPNFPEGQIRRWAVTEPPPNFSPRNVTFRLMWGPENLYIAARSPVPEDGRLIQQFKNAPPKPVLIHDDAYEFAVDASLLESFSGDSGDKRLYIINPRRTIQSREVDKDFKPYGKMEKSAQNLTVTSEIWEDEQGHSWWDMQLALDLDNIGVSEQLRAGNELKLSLGRIFQYPWYYTYLPVFHTYMNSKSLPMAKLSEENIYAQITEFDGLDKKRLNIKGRIRNPSGSTRKVEVNTRVLNLKENDLPGEKELLNKNSSVLLEPESEKKFTIEEALEEESGFVKFIIRDADNEDAEPVYKYCIAFRAEETVPLLPARPEDFEIPVDFVRFRRNAEELKMECDLLFAQSPSARQGRTLEYAILKRGSPEEKLLKGCLDQREEMVLKGSVNLASLPPEKYDFQLRLLDENRQVLAKRKMKGFDKITGEDYMFYLWRLETGAPPEKLSEFPPLDGLSPVEEKVNQWYDRGKAAGNIGDYYHNHDNLHSYLDIRKFPQVMPIDATPASLSLISHALQADKLYTGRVIGNASMVMGSSIPERAYQNPRYAEAFYQQYIHNHLYLYVTHTTSAEDYSAYTPYVVTSQGSSGSEQPHMEALFATLAALRPDTKKLLTKEGLIAPTLQMLLRRNYGEVSSDEEYLSAAAHPVIFKGDKLDTERMVCAAQELEPGEVPPVVRLEVIEESFGGEKGGEKLFTTPSAVARSAQGGEATHSIELSAEESFDANDRDLQWRWELLRGNSQKTRIQQLEQDNSRAEIRYENQSERVDIAVFTHNGANWSAPAIISVKP